MQHNKIDAYVVAVSQKIRWDKVRPDIIKELLEHITDRRDMYMSQGMVEEVATDKALEQMGDAALLGKELNRANRPTPEWARENAFIKATLRQPVRTFLLFALVLIASFAFVLRTTEFGIVRSSIFEAAGFYRSVGFFVPADGSVYADVNHVADMISHNRFAGFEDRRSGAQGVLVGMHNHDISSNSHMIRDDGSIINYSTYVSYFYATLQRVMTRVPGVPMRFELEIDSVIVGFPEHVIAGQTLSLDFFEDVALDLKNGERYFFAASFYMINWRLPQEGFIGDGMLLHPLNNDLWYIHVPEGYLDFSLPEMAGIAEDIERSRIKHQSVHVRTTKDMSSMPEVHEVVNQIGLVSGRLLTHADYLEARSVAVVHHRFARQRSIEEGDTITIEIPGGQRATEPSRRVLQGTVVATDHNAPEGWRVIDRRVDFFMDYRVKGDATTEPLVLELEVVGFHEIIPQIPLRDTTPFDSYIFIPDSLLLPDYRPIHDVYENFLPDFWYSFRLRDTRHESRFLVNYRNTFLAEGFEVVIIPSESENFWLSAEPVLRTATINLVLFQAVLLLVFGLVTYIFLLQRRKDFAILRALGQPVKICGMKLQYTLVMIFLPAVLIGGLGGWFIALNEAARTVSYALIETGAAEATLLPLYMLFPQLIVALVLLMLITYIGVKRTAKLPVLELLQGRGK